MKTIFAGAIFAIIATGSASAGCYHQGVTYGAGSQICSGGWLQECTVADYWKAIGYCRAEESGDKSAFTVIDEAQHKADVADGKAKEKPE